MNKLSFTVAPEHDSKNAGRYLRTVCGLSARTLSKLKRTPGGITVCGKTLRSSDIVRAGDCIVISMPPDITDITAVDMPLDIVYEDDCLLVVNKSAAMPVHPVKKHQSDTLANAVAAYSRSKGESYTFRALNRLDADTTGLVIIAKDRHTAFSLDSVKKDYTAVVHGYVDENGTVDMPIGLKPGSTFVRCVDMSGERAVTHYTVVKRLDNMTVLSLTLDTGRTHQIRCHMAHIGHPLCGDDLYGGTRNLIARQALHCGHIEFDHPISKARVVLDVPLPEDMQILIITLRENK